MKKPFSMSFSKLNTFENCPRRFFHTYIEPLPQTDSYESAVGTRVHKSLENYGRTKDTIHLTEESLRHKRVVDNILRRSGDKYYEHQMAIAANKEPCAWDATELWFRGIADVLVVDGNLAFCLDYKTGKPKHDQTQLTLLALLTFAHFPKVDEVKSGFLWLTYDDMTTTTYGKRHSDALWIALEQRIRLAQEAVEKNDFPCKPSKLCGWCPAKDFCEEAYREKRKRR